MANIDDSAIIESKQASVTSGRADDFNDTMDALLAANGLKYRLPPALSTVTRRVLQRHHFDRESYVANGNAVCVLNAGDLYINGGSSYLVFDAQATGTAGTISVGSGSGVNFIRRLTITSESGSEMERIEQVNVYHRNMSRYGHSPQWYDTVGDAMGHKVKKYNAGAVETQVHADKDIKASTQRFIIPMSEISGLWASKRLLPGLGCCSGMRIEIALESADVALVGDSSQSDTAYTLSNLAIVTDSFQLSDAVLKELNGQSASVSLEIPFQTYDLTTASLNSTAINVDAKRAVSRASMAFAVIRDSTNDVKNDFDSFISDECDGSTQGWDEYSYKLAGHNYPNVPLRNTREMYYNSLYAFGKLNEMNEPASVRFADWAGVPKATVGDLIDQEDAYNGGYANAAVLLERHTMLQHSGMPLSGSRILQLRGTKYDGDAKDLSLFTVFTRLARVFLDRVVVKE